MRGATAWSWKRGDCDLAKTDVEHLICGDAQLKKMDADMNCGSVLMQPQYSKEISCRDRSKQVDLDDRKQIYNAVSAGRNPSRIGCVTTMNQDIQTMLRRYRERDIDLHQLRVWLDGERTRADAQIPRGELLKLKRGSEAQSNGAIARLIPACVHCLGIGEPKAFISHEESQQYARRRDAALANSTLSEIPQPHFSSEGSDSAGSAMYCRCACCRSIWAFVEPEKAESGSWNRII
ncbi:hypothetical protein [Burkholderia lata]|uniref:hypothetical protein n=1 Tax=Burkholderia lata (strain ATCC 17760 / DSM 23089 / LMG 22485 / NCIMB 9086 / R18194 / 383) TaxID=482957 RepID=UPI0020C5D864|nr:hypothetical protein [Burkholderia lata]